MGLVDLAYSVKQLRRTQDLMTDHSQSGSDAYTIRAYSVRKTYISVSDARVAAAWERLPRLDDVPDLPLMPWAPH